MSSIDSHSTSRRQVSDSCTEESRAVHYHMENKAYLTGLPWCVTPAKQVLDDVYKSQKDGGKKETKTYYLTPQNSALQNKFVPHTLTW